MGTEIVALLESGDPVELSCDATTGDTATRIDVGTTATQGPKTFFTTTGEIGTANDGLINLGQVVVGAATGFDSFAYEATDEFTVVLQGDFSAFAPIEGADNSTRLVALSTNACVS
ncbi:hypothetical protein, partial [Lysobacter sp. A3-1-A15]